MEMKNLGVKDRQRVNILDRFGIRRGAAPCPLSAISVRRTARHLFPKCMTLLLIVSMLGLGYAQQMPVLSRHASAVKRKVDQLSPNAPISVIKVQGSEQYGQFQSDDNQSFTFFDIDLRKNVTLSFEEVRKIKAGYAGKNSLHQRHTDRTKIIVITVITLGAIGGLIAAAASAKD
jgi:hypothetical protein